MNTEPEVYLFAIAEPTIIKFINKEIKLWKQQFKI